MLKEQVVEVINKQINAELYSAYLYQAMSAAASAKDLPGIANWFNVQTKEELTHANMFYAYLIRQGAAVSLMAIDEPPSSYKSALDMFQKTLVHEKKVTALIGNMMDTAREARDHATEIFLQWFVTEQVEEEENATAIIGQLKLAGETGNGLFMIDRELGARVFTPPAAAAAD